MRILVLSKRQYMSRDLLDDRYGRFRELPLALASAGHKVTGICLSYRPRSESPITDADGSAQVVWHPMNLKRLLPHGSGSYWRKVKEIGNTVRPDLVWACSDAIHAILGVRVAKMLGTKLVVDLYDNFESFGLTRLPGMTSIFRRALRQADGITCVSRPLREYIRHVAHYAGPIAVMENAIPAGLFHSMDQAACRQKLGLPDDAYYIGTAGALSRSRGIATLFQAFDILSRERPDVRLALAGPFDKGLAPPPGKRVHYLGMLPPQDVLRFLCSLDISVICNRNSAFGRYCFPQKFHEAAACRIPVVAAATGSMRELLETRPQCLFEPDNADDLAATLRSQLVRPTVLNWHVPTWNELGVKLGGFLERVVRAET